MGFRPPDDTWSKHKAVWDACVHAGITPPKETTEFFGWEPPDNTGVEVKIEGTKACRKWKDEMQEGFEIVVSELPKDVKVVRVWNAW